MGNFICPKGSMTARQRLASLTVKLTVTGRGGLVSRSVRPGERIRWPNLSDRQGLSNFQSGSRISQTRINKKVWLRNRFLSAVKSCHSMFYWRLAMTVGFKVLFAGFLIHRRMMTSLAPTSDATPNNCRPFNFTSYPTRHLSLSCVCVIDKKVWYKTLCNCVCSACVWGLERVMKV